MSARDAALAGMTLPQLIDHLIVVSKKEERDDILERVRAQRVEKPHHEFSHFEDLSAGEAIEEIAEAIEARRKA